MNTYPVHFEYEKAQAHVTDRRRALVFGPGYPWTFDLVSVGFTVLLAGTALLLGRTVFRGWVGAAGYSVTVILWTVVLLNVVVGAVCAVVRGIRYRRAKAEADMVKPGLAMIFGPDGIQTEQQFIPWQQVREVRVDKRGFGWGWHLVVDADAGEVIRFPLDALDASPATLDLVVRAETVNRLGIDLRPIDRDVTRGSGAVAPSPDPQQPTGPSSASAHAMTD